MSSKNRLKYTKTEYAKKIKLVWELGECKGRFKKYSIGRAYFRSLRLGVECKRVTEKYAGSS